MLCWLQWKTITTGNQTWLGNPQLNEGSQSHRSPVPPPAMFDDTGGWRDHQCDTNQFVFPANGAKKIQNRTSACLANTFGFKKKHEQQVGDTA